MTTQTLNTLSNAANLNRNQIVEALKAANQYNGLSRASVSALREVAKTLVAAENAPVSVKHTAASAQIAASIIVALAPCTVGEVVAAAQSWKAAHNSFFTLYRRPNGKLTGRAIAQAMAGMGYRGNVDLAADAFTVTKYKAPKAPKAK